VSKSRAEFGGVDLGILVIPQGIGTNINLSAQILKIDIVEKFLQSSNRSVVEVVRRIRGVHWSERDWSEQCRLILVMLFAKIMTRAWLLNE
jgi:hypothetical protein